MRKITLTCAALLIFSIAEIAWAQNNSGGSSTFPTPRRAENTTESLRPHIGVLGGLSNPSDSFSTAIGYGIDAGFQPYIPFSVGMELSGFSTTRTQQDQDQRIDRTNLLVHGAYNFGGDTVILKDSYVGATLGAVFDANGPYTGTHSGLGPLVGFDIPLSAEQTNFFTLGLQAKYLFVSGPSPDSFNLDGMVKYWF